MLKVEKVLSLLFEAYATFFIVTGHNDIEIDQSYTNKVEQVKLTDNKVRVTYV